MFVTKGAFYAPENGQLFVRVADGHPDWQALAHVVRDEILPGSGPATSLAIKTALTAESCDDADADLADYPVLRDEVLAEFEQVAREHGETAGPHDTDGADADYDEREGDDGNTADEGDADDASTQGDDAETEDQQDDDEARQAGPQANGEPGARSRTQTGRGTRTGGDASSRPHAKRNGTAAMRGKKRHPSDNKDGASADYRLISYVVPNGQSRSHSDGGSHEQHLRDAAGEAGVDLVIKHLETELRGSGAHIEKMPEKNKGYDILVRDANGEPQRYIEVKATAGAWGVRGVGLTEPQFSLARKERQRYWLYVVEHLYQSEAHLWPIRNPAGRVTYFQYDHGWQTAAEGQLAVTGAHRTAEGDD